MISVAALKALAAAGATADMIVAAIEVELVADEARKERNRDRMRSVRARAGTPEHVQAQDLALSILPSLSESQTEKPKEEKKERAKRDRGQICPDDMHPSESHFEAGSKQNISRPRVEACCEAMKSWSKSNSNRAVARKSDWNAALFGWISREAERGNGNGPPNRPTGIGKPNANGITGTANGDRCRELAELARQGEAAAGIFRPVGALRGD